MVTRLDYKGGSRRDFVQRGDSKWDALRNVRNDTVMYVVHGLRQLGRALARWWGVSVVSDEGQLLFQQVINQKQDLLLERWRVPCRQSSSMKLTNRVGPNRRKVGVTAGLFSKAVRTLHTTLLKPESVNFKTDNDQHT